ncbi:MAG: ATPase [Alphaproteobacteria bacterium]|nr:ATPase [Alphaproteobacteria bacterium]
MLFAALPAQAEGAGLPQLDTSFYPEEMFWLAITFGLLYALMSMIALPRVARTKDNRKTVISGELEAARTANDHAKATSAEVEKSLGEARMRAQAHVADMIAKLEEETAAHSGAQEKELARKLRAVEADIAVAREAALKSVRKSAGDLAASVAEKAAGVKIQVNA